MNNFGVYLGRLARLSIGLSFLYGSPTFLCCLILIITLLMSKMLLVYEESSLSLTDLQSRGTLNEDSENSSGQNIDKISAQPQLGLSYLGSNEAPLYPR